jgi:4-hydroxy-2-oxoheptanedioate aldolase
MTPNRLKGGLTAGRIVTAVTINFPQAGLAEFLGNLGVDAVLIDGEHGAIGDTELESIAIACELAGCASLLRVVAEDATLQRYMGLGLAGIQLPQAQTAAQVRDVVGAVKYAPHGHRGLGNSRATKYGLGDGGFPAKMEASNEETVVLVQIEDEAGIAATEEIARIADVDAIIVGEADLSNALGVPGERDHPAVILAADEVIRIATEAGKPVGLAANTAEEAERAIGRGACLLISSVTRCLAIGASPLLRAARGG